MGSTHWSEDEYVERAKTRAVDKVETFAYHSETAKKSPSEQKAHPSLDPKGVKMRESRGSAEHPESLAIAVFLDVTGSMAQTPQMMQKKLPALMGLLLKNGYVDHPQIMVGAIGDATSDNVPLQVGQFESGIEIENDLTNIFLEGKGGYGNSESYELALHFMNSHTVTDCYEKRGHRGYIFIIGDERAYPYVKKDEAMNVIGDGLQTNIKIEDLVQELTKRYSIYYIIPKMTSHFHDDVTHKMWADLLGSQNVIKLEDPDGICECIATAIGLSEGRVTHSDVVDDLVEAGMDKSVASSVSTALSRVKAGERALAVAIPESGGGTGITTL